MKLFSIFILSAFLSATSNWGTDFEKAKKIAEQEHKLVLLNFSGYDWCGPCIRLHKEIFESPEFTQVADEKFVLVNADFPRQRKNQLDKQLQKNNDKLAEKYNTTGVFPLTVLLKADGTVIKKWEGYPEEGKNKFISEIKSAANAVN